jgi:hypothetical protein
MAEIAEGTNSKLLLRTQNRTGTYREALVAGTLQMLGLVLHALELHPAQRHSQRAWEEGTPDHHNPGYSPLASTSTRVTPYPHYYAHRLASPSTTSYDSQGSDIPGTHTLQFFHFRRSIKVFGLPEIFGGTCIQ